MIDLEELGYIFKNDPLFEYGFFRLPKGLFEELAKNRKKRLETKPDITDIL